MEPFTWIGMGAALMFVYQLATGKIDFNDPVPPRSRPISDEPNSLEAETPEFEEKLDVGLTEEFPPALTEMRAPSETTICRHTRLFSDTEYDEAASAIRNADRKPKKP